MNWMLGSLRDDELDLLRETEADQMAGLDEDQLLELHIRVRRARTKYVKLYRREAAARVQPSGGRGKARPKNLRNLEKAEVFEDALARVSKRVDIVARQAAKELKSQRIAAARSTPAGPTTQRPPMSRPGTRVVPHSKTTGGLKRDASSRSQGARRQTKRDAR